MALAFTTIFEVETGGSDTVNGGAFDPGQTAGMFTDGAATVATSSAPVFSSASYNFVAGDVGAWLYIASGTNWTSGWYKIVSVAANAATLSAALGAGVLLGNIAVTSAAGCATTASPTGATWTIDYSQQATAQFAYTDLASVGAGLLVSSVAKPFAKQQVGNAIVITGGTNFTAGRYVIASVAVGVATVVGAGNITTGAGVNGTGGLGGACASPGQVDGVNVAGNVTFIQQSGTVFSITSASYSVAAGCLSAHGQCQFIGYTSTRILANSDTRPTLQLNVNNATMFNGASSVIAANLICDGNNKTSAKHSAGGAFVNCKIMNFNVDAGGGAFVNCESTANSGTPFRGGPFVNCVAHGNSASGFGGMTFGPVHCLSYGNTGASSHGFEIIALGVMAVSCTAYGNGGSGFLATSGNPVLLVNCYAEANAAYGFRDNSGAGRGLTLVNCGAYNNTSGATFTGASPAVINTLNFVMPTASTFTNAGAGDFSLNATAGGGAALRATGSPGVFPSGASTGYIDIGAAQHADPVTSGGAAVAIFGG